MKTIGLLGGIASGKSLVAKKLAEQGAVVLDADRAGHEVLLIPRVKDAIRQRFGASVFESAGDGAGEVDRKKLASVVFANSDAGRRDLEFLEKVTHPEIARRLEEQIQAFSRQGAKISVLDAPVMLKAGWDRFCDQIWFIDAPFEMRLARAKTRGWSEEEFRARELAQEPIERKRELADLVLDNSADMEYTQRQIERYWRLLAG